MNLAPWRRKTEAALERSAADPLISMADYLGMLETFAFQGVSYTLPGASQEQVSGAYRSLARYGYKANAVVFACMNVRASHFSEARFQFRRLRGGRPGDLFGTADLEPLERPWPGATTGDLLARMLQHADLGGNSFVTDRFGGARPLRPDWMKMIIGSYEDAEAAAWDPQADVVGYMYEPGGPHSGRPPVFFDASEIAHFAPIPDPEAQFRGMSWLTPLIREIMADKAATDHKLAFFEHGATPNVVVKAPAPNLDEFKLWIDAFREGHEGAANAYKTIFLGAGWDMDVVGADMRELDFKLVQGAGETRIAAAANVPPIIVGLSEGLQAATYSCPYGQQVWTLEGPREIGDLRAGDRVWKLVGGRVEAGTVTWQGQTGTAPVYTVKTKNRTFQATANHPVLMEDGSWKRVDDLTCQDRVLAPVLLPDQGADTLPNGQLATAEAMRWLGAFIGDGSLSQGGNVRMSIPAEDRVRGYYEAIPPRLFTKAANGNWQHPGRRAKDGLTEQMVSLRDDGHTFREIRDLMGLDMHPMSVRDRVKHATRTYEGERQPVRVADCRNGFRFNSVEAGRWLTEMGVTGHAKQKRVPSWVFGLREDLRLEFLAGIVDTDGSIGKDGRLVIQFANRALVSDVRMLLVSCGIQCSNLAYYRYDPSVLPNPGSKPFYEAWRLTASSARKVARIPFADELYRDRVQRNDHRHRPNKRGSYKIMSIERGRAHVPVYDIEVDGGDSVFLADGVGIHNSNYGQARRRFADGSLRPLWRNAAGSLARIVNVPGDSELWFDERDISFLKEDLKDAAEITSLKASAMMTLVNSGYDPDSVIAAVNANDLSLLQHTGLVSVQLQPPGTDIPGGGGQQPALPPAKPKAPTSGQNGKREALDMLADLVAAKED